MIVSKLNGQYNYGIDLSDRGAEVFEISMEDFYNIQSGKSEIKDNVVIQIEHEEISEEEIKEDLKKQLIEKYREIHKKSLEKRLEYITVRDMLEEGNPIREMKLQKLSYEGDQIMIEFEQLVTDLIANFGESVLVEII